MIGLPTIADESPRHLFPSTGSNSTQAMTAAETDAAMYAGAAATLPCVFLDTVIHGIQRWQRKKAGAIDIASFGWITRTSFSVLINAVLSTGFAYIYGSIGAGTANAFLGGGVVWLMISIPLILISQYQDDLQKSLLATRLLGWLLKTSIAAAAVTHFLG